MMFDFGWSSSLIVFWHFYFWEDVGLDSGSNFHFKSVQTGILRAMSLYTELIELLLINLPDE